MADFGLTLLEAKRLTIRELGYYQKAHKKSYLNRELELYLQAFLNRVVNATDKAGKKYIYKDFNAFYDQEKRKEDLLGTGLIKNSALAELARRNLAFKAERGLLDG